MASTHSINLTGLITGFAAAFLICTPAKASEYSDGSDFMRQLVAADTLELNSGADMMNIGLTWGYLQGAADSHAIMRALNAGDFCDDVLKPSLLTNEQRVLLVIKWMRNNPAEWDQHRISMIHAA